MLPDAITLLRGRLRTLECELEDAKLAEARAADDAATTAHRAALDAVDAAIRRFATETLAALVEGARRTEDAMLAADTKVKKLAAAIQRDRGEEPLTRSGVAHRRREWPRYPDLADIVRTIEDYANGKTPRQAEATRRADALAASRARDRAFGVAT